MNALIIGKRDNPTVQDWVRILNTHTYDKIEIAQSLRHVSGYLKEGEVELVIVDYDMRSMSVFNSVSMNAHWNIGIISIVVTNHSSSFDLINHIDKRPCVTIQRPLQISEMKTAIKRAFQINEVTALARECFINNDSKLAVSLLKEILQKTPLNAKVAKCPDYISNIMILLETIVKVDGFVGSSKYVRSLHNAFKSLRCEDVCEQITNLVLNHYLSESNPSTAISLTMKLLNKTPSLPSTLFALSMAHSDLGDVTKSQQLLELVDASNQFSSSLYSLRAFNLFSMNRYEESVIEQLQSIRWLNVEIDPKETVFKEYQMLSHYAKSYLEHSTSNVDFKLINSVEKAFCGHDDKDYECWINNQLLEIKVKSLFKSGDSDKIELTIKDIISNNRSVLSTNKELREFISKRMLMDKVDPLISDFFSSFESNSRMAANFSSENREKAEEYLFKSKKYYDIKDFGLAEEYILKARVLFPSEIRINILHVRININIYRNIRSKKLLEDSYKYLEKIFDSVDANTDSHNEISSLMLQLDNLA